MSNNIKATVSKLVFALALMVGLAAMNGVAMAKPTLVVGDGKTTVNLSQGFLNALATLRVSAGSVGEGSLRSGIASFPVTGGALDLGTAKGEINHAGGLFLAAGSTRVELISFNIDTTGASPVLTGLVIVNGDVLGRVPLFKLTLPAVTLPLREQAFNTFFLPGVGVTLTSEAAGALNAIFGVTAFAADFNIGNASVFLAGQPPRGRGIIFRD